MQPTVPSHNCTVARWKSHDLTSLDTADLEDATGVYNNSVMFRKHDYSDATSIHISERGEVKRNFVQ